MTSRQSFYLVHLIVLLFILFFLWITGNGWDVMLAIFITYVMAVVVSDLIT